MSAEDSLGKLVQAASARHAEAARGGSADLASAVGYAMAMDRVQAVGGSAFARELDRRLQTGRAVR